MGHTDEYGNNLVVDGIIGKNTTYAIKDFQKISGLTVDGIVGDITWVSLGLMLNTDVTNRLTEFVYAEMVKCDGKPYYYSGDYYEKLLYFYELVKLGSNLDLKNNSNWPKSHYYIFDNGIYRYDGPGNIAYGIAGEAMGFSLDLLLKAAGVAQIRAENSNPQFENSNWDDPYDQLCILAGYMYAKRR